MEKKRVLTNFYPAVLWNTSVYGKSKKVVASNLYEKEADVEFENGVATRIKTDLISSEVSKAFLLEIVLLKYVPLILLIWFAFNVNLYYPSMVGLGLASIVYLGFYWVKKRVSTFFAYVFLASLFLTYISMFVSNFSEFLFFNINNIGNYVIQYFVALWLIERLFIDIYSLNFMNVYKIKNLFLTYFQIVDDEISSFKEKRISSAKKVFVGLLILTIVFTGIVGGFDFVSKILASNVAQQEILVKEKNERKIIQSRNARALKQLLDQQAKELGINKHNTKEQLALMEDDFDKYVKTQPIAYERLRLNITTTLLNIKTGETISPLNAGVVRSWIQNYKGVYRWHYYDSKSKQTYVVMNTKAR